MPALSVVIPVWNEERRIARGLAGVAELRRLVGEDLEVLVVDDGSTDATADLATTDGVRVLREPHRGKGGALRAGVAAATGDRVLLVDVDWSVGPRAALDLLAADGDVVVAVREGHGARRLGEPEWRHTLGRAFNWLVAGWVLSGHRDTQCGCKLLRREVAVDLFARQTVTGWAYDVELLYLANLDGYRVVEVPVVWVYEEESRLEPLRDGLAMVRELRRIQANARSGRYRSGKT
jgi:glycosyltransferase involved in cell wall biosynthesis